MMKRIWILLLACLLLFPLLTTAAGPSVPAKEALQKKVQNVTFKGTLAQAVQQIETLSGLRVEVDWPAVRDTGVKDDAPVLVKITDATVEQALNLILSDVSLKGKPLAFYVDNGVVRVTTQMRALYPNRPAVAASSPASQPTSRPTQVREMSFENVPVSDVLDFVQQASAGVNFHVNWNSLQTVGIDRNTKVSLRASNITIARALDLLTTELSTNKNKFDSVYWIIDDGIVTIATGTAFNNTLKTRVYEVGDVLMAVPNFVGPRMQISGTGGSSSGNSSVFQTDNSAGNTAGGSTEGESVVEQRQRMRDGLIAVVQHAIGDDMWQPNGKGSIVLMRDKMVISQTLLGFKLLEQTMNH